MAQVTLLAQEQLDDGRHFIQRFAADGNCVKAAFWAMTADEGYLYVASDIMDREGPAASYRNVRAALQPLGDCSISGSNIKVISPNNLIA